MIVYFFSDSIQRKSIMDSDNTFHLLSLLSGKQIFTVL